VADGFMTHPSNTNPRYLREFIHPNLAHGARRCGRDLAGLERIASTFVATGIDDESVARERQQLRHYLGFVFSTRQYWPTLELLGWPDVGPTLLEIARAGQWEKMPEVIGDDLFEALVPCAPYADIAPVLLEWYGGLVDAVTLRMPSDPANDPDLAAVIEQLRAA